jgi:APA family basic amino acid/polyamine antiporter
MMAAPPVLKRKLGLLAVVAVVAGDMLGSGVFFTPGELAAMAQAPWQVYFLWGLCGFITLCGALTLAELSTLLPRAGASYHMIREAFGSFWGFFKIWIELLVSGPGSVAAVAILFGEFAAKDLGLGLRPTTLGALAIASFAAINLAGVEWGARTQITLTAIKLFGLMALVLGALFLAVPAPVPVPAPAGEEDPGAAGDGLLGLVRMVGLGVAVVLYTYDGWVDVTHVAGEVKEPQRNLPLGLGLGVAGIALFYLLINYAYLRVVPLPAMRADPTGVASQVSAAAFGPSGGRALNLMMMISILGAMGGLVMTLPRLYYAAAATRRAETQGAEPQVGLFPALALVSAKRSVPYGAILFSAGLSIAALLFLGTFQRIASFLVVPLHLINILMVASIFPLRRRFPRPAGEGGYRTPGYPVVPLVYIGVLSLFLVSAIVYQPIATAIGVFLALTAVPAYFWTHGRRSA